MEYARNQLNKYQTDPKLYGAKDAIDVERLEKKNEELRNEMKERDEKYYIEKSENDKLKSRIEELEKKITKLVRENERYEEEIREYEKNRTQIIEQKYRAGPEQEKNLKIIGQKNKIIGELEHENDELRDENQRLNEHIRESRGIIESYTVEMQKTTREINEIKELLKRSDTDMRILKQENDQMRFQLENYRAQVDKKSHSDGAIIEKYVHEYEMKLASKDEDIRKLTELVIELRDSLDRTEMDSDKATVSSLTKTLGDKEKQIALLKQQIEDCRKEMDKSAAVINNLNKTFYESKLESNYF